MARLALGPRLPVVALRPLVPPGVALGPRPPGGALGQALAGLHTGPRLDMRLTAPLASAMTAKKRKQDPAQEKAKEEKRRKRLTKALRKMEKKARQPKPLSECEVPLVLSKEAVARRREVEVTEEEREARVQQDKDWARFCLKRHQAELVHIDKVLKAQARALEALREESEELYQAAVEFDPGVLELELKGPTATPPIPGHLQDGEYKDETPSYKVIYEDTEAYMKTLLLRRRKRRRRDDDE